MIYILAGLIGILLGVYVDYTIPAVYSAYVGVAILAGLDTIFGGFVAILDKKFNMKIFVSGLFGNGILAVVLVLIGKLIGIDLTIAAVVVFGTRIFSNLATLRRFGLGKAEDVYKGYRSKAKN
jgi:small basic protein